MSLVVVRAIGLVTVQDLGRPGHMHEGLAWGGALAPELAANANRRVQNPDNAAVIEVMGMVTVRADRTVVVATDETEPRELGAGEELSVASEHRRVTYLALRGGIDAPVVLGSRSTQLSAGLGRVLRSGDVLPVGDAVATVQATVRLSDDEVIRVIPGPDLASFATDALEVLTSAPYVVLPSSDRVGTRLEGPRLLRADGSRADTTRPMVRGAIEVPPDGQPIVLGPDHPTTGGYPVIGVVAYDELARFFATGIGRHLRFRTARL